MAFTMPMRKIISLDLEASRFQTLTYFFRSAIAMIAEKQSITSLPLMVVIIGKSIVMILTYFREVSHPNLIEMLPISAKGYPECTNIAQLTAVS